MLEGRRLLAIGCGRSVGHPLWRSTRCASPVPLPRRAWHGRDRPLPRLDGGARCPEARRHGLRCGDLCGERARRGAAAHDRPRRRRVLALLRRAHPPGARPQRQRPVRQAVSCDRFAGSSYIPQRGPRAAITVPGAVDSGASPMRASAGCRSLICWPRPSATPAKACPSPTTSPSGSRRIATCSRPTPVQRPFTSRMASLTGPESASSRRSSPTRWSSSQRRARARSTRPPARASPPISRSAAGSAARRLRGIPRALGGADLDLVQGLRGLPAAAALAGPGRPPHPQFPRRHRFQPPAPERRALLSRADPGHEVGLREARRPSLRSRLRRHFRSRACSTRRSAPPSGRSGSTVRSGSPRPRRPAAIRPSSASLTQKATPSAPSRASTSTSARAWSIPPRAC